MRLIDADALNLDREVELADDWKTAHEIANCVKYAPTVDAVPVVHGRWIGYPECLQYINAYSDDHIVCSACEECFSIIDNCAERFDYCPHCGAKMDLEGTT